MIAIPLDRRLEPLFAPEEATPPRKASMLKVHPCDPQFARWCNEAWHSRLPHTQSGPWMLAFVAEYEGTAFAVALWHNPSARNLPAEWLELRRLAVAPDAPHCAASMMLGQMRRWIRRNRPDIQRLISYQDEEVHTGTIYRAAGWTPAWRTAARQRDRSSARRGTNRDYRSDANGANPAAASKMRWETKL